MSRFREASRRLSSAVSEVEASSGSGAGNASAADSGCLTAVAGGTTGAAETEVGFAAEGLATAAGRGVALAEDFLATGAGGTGIATGGGTIATGEGSGLASACTPAVGCGAAAASVATALTDAA